MARRTQHICLAAMPDGVPSQDDFTCVEAPLPPLEEGYCLLRILYISIDPYQRLKLSGRHISGGIAIGDVMPGEGVADVVESRIDGIKPGTLVRAPCGWQSHAVLPQDEISPLGFDEDLPPSLALGIVGMPGLTAYAGVTRLCTVRPGCTFLVSAAAGAVGSLAGQLAKARGARVIGIAGGAQKCTWVRNEARFDACIDYKTDDVGQALTALAPDGIDIYFDNVGGAVLKTALSRLALHGQIILCGLMAQLNDPSAAVGLNPAMLIRQRASVRGLIVYDHEDLRGQMVEEVTGLIREGKVVYHEDIRDGLENTPQAFIDLMHGRNFGKTLVRLR